jgi:hypothetical protein
MDSSDAAAASSAEAAQISPASRARNDGRDVVRAEIKPRTEAESRSEVVSRADTVSGADAAVRADVADTDPGQSSTLAGSPPGRALSPRAQAIVRAASARAASAGLDALSQPRAGVRVSPTDTSVPRNPLTAPTELDLRRKRKRRPLGAGQSLITILDGPRAGEEFDTSLRDFALQQTIFLLKSELRIGQRIEIEGPGAPRDPLAASTDPREAMKPVVAEVVRSRLLSNGRWEIVAERVKASAPPKISESQRRHERRRQRLAQQGVILNTTMRPIAPKDEPPTSQQK